MAVTDVAADILTEENIWQMHTEAVDAWCRLAEEILDERDTLEQLDVLRDVSARLEALRPTILDYASRGPARLAELRRIAEEA